MRWAPIAVNSAFLLGAIMLPGVSLHENTNPVAVRYLATCAPIGPIASQYVDKKKLCRRARKEALRSLKTGRDPDWGDVARDSIPRASKRPRRHQSPKHPPHRMKKHQADPTPPQATPTVGTTRGVRPSTRPEVRPPTAERSSATPEPVPPPRDGITPTSTSRAKPDDHRPWLVGRTGAVALLVLLSLTFYAGGQRHTVARVTKSMLNYTKKNSRTSAKPTSTTPSRPMPPGTSRIVPFATQGITLAGPGAEDAVRRMAIDVLNSRRADTVELVLNRPDVWRLFGADVGTLQEDRVPGLVLTDDLEETRGLLSRQGMSRRLLITCDSKADDFRDLLSRQPGQLTVISLAPQTEPTATVAADGEVAANPADPSLPGRLPLLSRPEAFDRLMSMPTLARHPS